MDIKERTNNFISLLKDNCNVSSSEGSIIDCPFFSPDNAEEFELKSYVNSEYTEFLGKFPFLFKILYMCVGADREINFKSGFTLLRLKEVHGRFDTYDNFTDVGLTYMGMGHVMVLSMDKKSNKFFFRHDGGSNGYERDDNYNKYKTFSVENNPNLKNFEEVVQLFVTNANLNDLIL
jgi:hypothetical protein